MLRLPVPRRREVGAEMRCHAMRCHRSRVSERAMGLYEVLISSARALRSLRWDASGSFTVVVRANNVQPAVFLNQNARGVFFPLRVVVPVAVQPPGAKGGGVGGWWPPLGVCCFVIPGVVDWEVCLLPSLHVDLLVAQHACLRTKRCVVLLSLLVGIHCT